MSEDVKESLDNTYSDLGLTEELIQPFPEGVELTREVRQRLEQDFYIVESLNQIIDEDDDAEDWKTLDKINNDRIKRMEQARWLIDKSPHCKRAIDLYKYYILSNRFRVSIAPIIDDYDELTPEKEKKNKKITKQSERVWKKLRRVNRKSWTPAEKLERVLRDGECFEFQLQKDFDGEDAWVPRFRFIDPEEIDDGEGEAGTKGIITDPSDVTEPVEYQRYDIDEGKVVATLPAEIVYHWKINADSNEKRGKTQFYTVIDYIRQLMSLVHNEVTHRTAQSAIILIRKVAGKNKVRQVTDNSQTSTTQYPEGTIGREKLRAGSIITSNPNVEYEFAQPKGDFSDATPLVNLLIGHLSSATGWTYAQITTDPGQGNFSSALVNESPVLQMIEYWQSELAEHIDDQVRFAFEAAIEAGEIEYEGDDFWAEYEPEYHFPIVANMNPKDNAQRLNLAIVNRTMSRAQAQREMSLDPNRMAYEIQKEDELAITDMAMQGGTNPTMGNMRQSSAQNAKAGGQNQGSGDDIQHRDKVGVRD